MSCQTSIKTSPGAEGFLESIARLRVLIIGDVMIDSYLWGKVDRISPEAPVPVVLVGHRDKRLGGAANVALNVQSLGATPILCSVIGSDREGKEFLDLLDKNGLSPEGIVVSESRVTTIKHRVMSGSHHLIRLDAEQDSNLDEIEGKAIREKLFRLLPDVDVVIFEDYDKGVLNERLIHDVVDFCNARKIPTIVDPKKRNFLAYRNVSLFKPNKKELKEGLKLDSGLNDLDELKTAVAKLRSVLSPELILITLSDQGVYVETQKEYCHIAAHKREISDVSGAGDTVISVAAVCYACGLSPERIAAIANLAGGIVCEYVGVVPIDKEILVKEMIRLNLVPEATGDVR